MDYNEIYTLLVRYIDGEVTAEEKVVMEELLRTDTYWKNEFEIITTINHTSPDVINAQTDANWEALKSQISVTTPSRTVNFNYWLSFSKYAAAAVIIFVAGWFLLKPSNTDFASFDAGKTYKTGAKEIRTITLDDGSIITLNQNSVLYIDKNFNKSNRRIELNGEAYFEVSKNSLKPFITKTKTTFTKVIGTSFEIESTTENKVLVSLYEGEIQFLSGNEKVTLTHGQKLTCFLKSNIIEKQTVKSLVKDRWASSLSFKDATLETIIKKLELQYNVSILIPADRKNEQYTVSFEGHNLQSSIRLIEELTDSKISKKDSDYIINP